MLDKSTSEETLRFVFDIFDVNKDGKIYRNQLGYVTRSPRTRALLTPNPPINPGPFCAPPSRPSRSNRSTICSREWTSRATAPSPTVLPLFLSILPFASLRPSLTTPSSRGRNRRVCGVRGQESRVRAPVAGREERSAEAGEAAGPSRLHTTGQEERLNYPSLSPSLSRQHYTPYMFPPLLHRTLGL